MLSGSTLQDKFSQLQTMGATGTLFSIVQLLSTGVSAHEWQMYKKRTDGRRRYGPTDIGSDQRQEIVSHPALDLWNNPNPFMTGEDFREIGWQFMELVGEWYWVLNRGPNANLPPTEIWPVRPDRMEPVPDRDKFLAGWIYTGPNGEMVPLSKDEVIQIKYPCPTDFYRGMSAVQSLLADIDSARYTAEWSRNFFLNSATPGGIVQFSKRLSDPEFKEFTTRWREQHQGVSRGHRVGILEQGATWFPNTYTIREMQFVELRTMSREIMREAYRIHESMLGLSTDVNRANAQTAQEVHIAWQEVPRLRRMRSALNNRLLPMYGSMGTGKEFDFADPTPQSLEAANLELGTKAQAVALLVKANTWEPDDILEAVGLPPMKQLEAPAVPAPGQRPALSGPDPVPGYPDETAPDYGGDQNNAIWNEISDAEYVEMSKIIRETFKVRSKSRHNLNGYSKEHV